MKPTQRLSPVKRFVAVRVMPAVVILISALFASLGVQNARLAQESRDWPSVAGEVVRSAIDVDVQTSGSVGRGSRTYRPVIHYRYRVGDRDYEGVRVAFGEYASEDRADAELVVRRYPVGRRLPVHYRPGAPDLAVLEPGSHGFPWLYAVVGGVFLLVGLLLAWVAPKLIAPAG